jgi:hypothetical protein
MTDIYLTLLRLGRDLQGEERGILEVWEGNRMMQAFSTRENDATLKTSSLRMGVYEMKHSWKKFDLQGRPMREPLRCLRPTDSRIQKILIHRAFNNDPNTLVGCIAPGIWGNVDKFTDSEQAMDLLFEFLGRFTEDKLVTLVVQSNASGVGYGETKENWWRTR